MKPELWIKIDMRNGEAVPDGRLHEYVEHNIKKSSTTINNKKYPILVG